MGFDQFYNQDLPKVIYISSTFKLHGLVIKRVNIWILIYTYPFYPHKIVQNRFHWVILEQFARSITLGFYGP